MNNLKKTCILIVLLLCGLYLHHCGMESKARPSDIGERKLVRKPTKSGLRAAFVDDNKQFNYFVNFLRKFKSKVRVYDINISERIKISVLDQEGKSVANCKITIKNQGGKVIYQAKTYADGTALFFPSEIKDRNNSVYKATARYQGMSRSFTIRRQGKRNIKIKLKALRKNINNVPLDVVFVLDTTGSMGEEIKKLKTAIDNLYLNISMFRSKPNVRFGMVLYKDRKESYRTKVIPLTNNLDRFKKALNQVKASGGGDGPEDLQSALEDTMQKLKWRKKGIRMAFIITDASAHLDYGQNYTYIKACHDARKKGIKLFTLGTGGLDTRGEYILRQISQYTYANYIFLHYGEKGDSKGGRAGAVSHHTGSNYVVKDLESLLIRLTKKELSYLTNQPVEDDEEYWRAKKISGQNDDAVLKELFNKAISKLSDYSSIKIPKGTAIAVLPIVAKNSKVSADADYFFEHLTMAVKDAGQFKLVDRNALDKILKEQRLSSSSLFNEKKTVKLGRLIGAKALLLGNLYLYRGELVLFIKLVRVQTGEILSVSKLKIQPDLRVALHF